jgi:hypothetical protein
LGVGKVAFRFKQASCIVAGTFNIYVVQPSLLVHLGIIPEDERQIQIQVNLRQPTLRFSPEATPGLSWQVSSEHLIAEADRPATNFGHSVAEILKALQFTPLRGIGTNILFFADPDEITSIAGRRLFPELPVPSSGETTQRTIHAAIKREENIFNVQAAITKDGIELSLNVHTDLINIPKLPDANRMAVEAAEDFDNRTTEAVEIARSLLGIEIIHGRNND